MTSGKDSELAEVILELDRGAQIDPIGATPLRFPVHHPQGLVRVGDRWWLSTVDVHREEGHLLGFDDNGELSADVLLVDGPRFHPGGIDGHGTVVIVPVAEYRPRSSTALFRVDVTSGAAEVVGRLDDHIGALAAPASAGTTTAMTWGSREVLVLDRDFRVIDQRPNPSHWIDVQDLQRLDDGRVLCSGVSYLVDANRLLALGGIGIWDEAEGAWAFELPVATAVASGRVLTNNPVWAEVHEGAVLLHAVPDDDVGTLLTYRLRAGVSG